MFDFVGSLLRQVKTLVDSFWSVYMLVSCNESNRECCSRIVEVTRTYVGTRVKQKVKNL